MTTATRSHATARTTIMLVDDHPIVRRGIAELIVREPDLSVCAEASSMQEAIALAAKHHPGLMIVDVSLDGNNGLELMKNMSGRDTAPFLVYSMHDETVYAERCLPPAPRDI